MHKAFLWLPVLTIKEGLFSDKIVILRKKAGRKGSGSLSEEGKPDDGGYADIKRNSVEIVLVMVLVLAIT